MTLNNECVRALILWLEENQTVRPNGKPDVIMLHKIYGCFPDFSAADLNIAASYLVQKKLISLRDGQTVLNAAPRAFAITGITAVGYDYIAAVKDDGLWKKIKDRVGSVALASVPTVIEVAAKLL